MRSLEMQQARLELALEVAIESLERSGQLRLRVTGTSMLPSIRPGSCVKIRRTGIDDVGLGDVVLLKAHSGLRLHRLIDVRRTGDATILVTRGDSHTEDDPAVPSSQLLGVLAGVEKPVRRRAELFRDLVLRGVLRRLVRSLLHWRAI